MPIVRFEQDPTQPYGTGNFTDDKGRILYTTDVETAKSLQPSLADQVSSQSKAIATQTVGAPTSPTAGMVASNEGATGSAATGAPPVSPAALVASTDQLPPSIARPAEPAPIAKPAPLPVSQSSTSTTKIEGRPVEKVMDALNKFHEADTAYDKTTRENATKADERAAASLDAQKGIELGATARQMSDYQTAQQQRQAAEEEIKRLRGQPDEQVQPTRLLDNMSTGQSLGMVILAGISGAFGNMRGQGQNTFMDAINKRIDQDIEVQKDQIATGRIRRNNLIADAMARGADAKQAEAIARSKFYEAGANVMKLEAQKQGIQGANLAQAEQHIAELNEARAQRDNDLLASTEAKKQTTSTTVREAPKSASGASVAEDLTKKLAARKAYEESGATPEQLSEFDNRMGIPSPQGKSEIARKRENEDNKQTEDEGKASSALSGITGYGDALGLTRDPQTGKLRAPGGVKGRLNIPRVKEEAGGLLGAAKPIEAAREAAKESFGRLQSGGVISEDEAKRFGKMIGEDGQSLDQIATRLNSIEAIIRPRLAARQRNQSTAAPADWK